MNNNSIYKIALSFRLIDQYASSIDFKGFNTIINILYEEFQINN